MCIFFFVIVVVVNENYPDTCMRQIIDFNYYILIKFLRISSSLFNLEPEFNFSHCGNLKRLFTRKIIVFFA